MSDIEHRLERRRALQALALVPLLAVMRGAGAASREAPAALGYLPWWMSAAWPSMPIGYLSRVVLFDTPILRDGSLQERPWEALAPGLLQHLAAGQLAPDFALTLLKEGDFDALFGDGGARRRLLAACIGLLERPIVAGLHLDIEGFTPASAAAVRGFRAWLAALDRTRRDLGRRLSVFFPASDEFTPYSPDIASRIDYWVAQVYDAHWAESPVTGPLVTRAEDNPVGIRRALARIAALGVERTRILLSVPLYGWEWPSESEKPQARTLGRARLVTFAPTPAALMPDDRIAATQTAQRVGLRRDGEHTPYYAHRETGRWVQGWYEDLDSLKPKLAPERQRRYGGLAFFPLGYDEGAVLEPMLRWWRSDS